MEKSYGLTGRIYSETEGIDKAAARILKERTALDKIYLEQFRVFGDENRIRKNDSKQKMKSELHKFDKKRFNTETTKWITAGLFALDIMRWWI